MSAQLELLTLKPPAGLQSAPASDPLWPSLIKSSGSLPFADHLPPRARCKTQGVRSEVWGPERRLNGTANATIGVPTCDARIEPDEHEAILGAKSAKIHTLNDRFRKSLDRRTRHDDRRR
jgi:hypothetical protein